MVLLLQLNTSWDSSWECLSNVAWLRLELVHTPMEVTIQYVTLVFILSSVSKHKMLENGKYRVIPFSKNWVIDFTVCISLYICKIVQRGMGCLHIPLPHVWEYILHKIWSLHLLNPAHVTGVLESCSLIIGHHCSL